jgi:hypothetical protein
MTTAKDIVAALRRQYGGKNASTCIAFEVAYGTGRHANRHVDAVVMEMWPSRGLTLHAMEIKVSLSDYKRELADPAKAEEIAQHCDFFSIVAPYKMLKEEKLPHAWGLIGLDGNGLLKTIKAPKKTRARAVDRHFMAAMLRAAVKPANVEYENEINRYRNELNSQFEARVRAAVEQRKDNNSTDAALWRQLEKELADAGVPYQYDPEVLKAVVFVLKSGAINTYSGVLKIRESLFESLEVVDKAIKEAGV